MLSDDWGEFDYFIELTGQFVNRQVNVYDNAEVLRYSREHWCDAYGCMFIGKFSLKQKATRDCDVISALEFERVWKRSLESENWSAQQNTAKMADWGNWSERVQQ